MLNEALTLMYYMSVNYSFMNLLYLTGLDKTQGLKEYGGC